MASTSDIKNGLCIKYNNDIYNRVTTPNQTIISYDFTSQNGVIKYGIDKPFNVNILRQIVSDFYFASLNDPKYQGIINTANANTTPSPPPDPITAAPAPPATP
jgi:hypothetical protein